MNHNTLLLKGICMSMYLFVVSFTLHAQTPHSEDHSDIEALKQANNPLASIKTANVHNYYIPSLYGAPDVTLNQAWLRYAQPIGQFIVRASLPFVTSSPADEGPTSGLGDLNAFVIYKFKMKSEGMEVGIGPALTFPTATNDLGSGKWQVGLSAIAFFKSSPIIQIGSLLTWQMSVAGDSDRSDINQLTPQLFFMWQLGGGTYLRSTGIWTFDLENGTYNVPIGLGIGRVIKSGGKMFNIFMEPQYSVYSYGVGQPKLQVFIGFNTQFH